MTDNVHVFAPRGTKDDAPHWAGEAVCLACRHEWSAVAPTGCYEVRCPKCELKRGVAKYNFGGVEGDCIFACHCKAENFFFRRRHGRTQILCVGCGEEKDLDSVFPR